MKKQMTIFLLLYVLYSSLFFCQQIYSATSDNAKIIGDALRIENNFLAVNHNDIVKLLNEHVNEEITIVIERKILIQSNIVFPENITVAFKNEGGFVISKNVLIRINGFISSEQRQIFFDEGNVIGNIKNENVFLEWFGAKKDVVNIKSEVFFNKAILLGNKIYVSKAIYELSSPIIINKNNVKIFGKGTICYPENIEKWLLKEEPKMILIKAQDIVIDGISLDAKNLYFSYLKPTQTSWIIYSSATNAKNIDILNCTFTNHKRLNHLSATIGFTVGSLLGRNSVTNCVFKDISGGAIFSQTSNTLIKNNRIINFGDAGIALNGPGASECTIDNNYLENNYNNLDAIAIENGANKWMITNNNIKNCAIGIRAFSPESKYQSVVNGGTIENNTIKTDENYKSTYGVKGIYIDSFYDNVKIKSNSIIGLLSGTAKDNSAAFGIYLANVPNVIVEKNKIGLNNSGNIVRTLIHIGGKTNCLISNNVFDGGSINATLAERGIEINASFTGVLKIYGNEIQNIKANGIDFQTSKDKRRSLDIRECIFKNIGQTYVFNSLQGSYLVNQKNKPIFENPNFVLNVAN